MTLKPVTRAQWVEALRSGEYKQGRGSLYSTKDDGFCCLGVLGSLAGGTIVRHALFGMMFDFDGYHTPGSAHIPDELARMVGIDHDMEVRLANMNDSHHSFKDIADYIDKLPVEKP